MKSIFLFCIAFFSCLSEKEDLKFNFGNTSDKCSDWIMLTDNVMGGITTSKLVYNENSMLLSGNISLENYGGFSSVKTRFRDFDLSEYKGLRIRVKSFNQKFAFTLEDSKNWTMPNYKTEILNSKDNTWEIATIYFKDFKEYQIGEPTGSELNLSKLKNIVRLGIITNEKKEGPFSLEVDFIEFIK